MDGLTRLLAIEDIKQLKARYARLVDGKQWDSLADLFAEDAVLRHPHLGEIQGQSRIVEALSASVGNATFTHFVGMPEIHVQSDRTARGIWAAIVQGRRHDSHGDWIDEGRTEYQEDYRKDPEGHWRIVTLSSRPLTRVSYSCTFQPGLEQRSRITE
jgi:ketosteroid isomerase-like protein